MKQFELMLTERKHVVWEGETWQDAIARFLDCNPGNTVVAWRIYPQHGLFVGNHKNISQLPIS